MVNQDIFLSFSDFFCEERYLPSLGYLSPSVGTAVLTMCEQGNQSFTHFVPPSTDPSISKSFLLVLALRHLAEKYKEIFVYIS